MEGEFYFSENEMIRKRVPFYKQIITSKFWYFLGSRYGERPSWAFINIFGIIAVFSLLYSFFRVNITEKSDIVLSCWQYPIAHALSPLTFNKWQITAPNGLFGLFLYLVEGALLATQIGLFINALRRRLQR